MLQKIQRKNSRMKYLFTSSGNKNVLNTLWKKILPIKGRKKSLNPKARMCIIDFVSSYHLILLHGKSNVDGAV